MEKYRAVVHIQEVGESEKITGVYIRKGDVLICDLNLTGRSQLRALSVEEAVDMAERIVELLNGEDDHAT